MREYTTKGTIITQPIVTNAIKSGSIVLIRTDNGFKRIVIMHIENNNLIVAGDYTGTLPDTHLLFRLSVLTINNGCFPICFTDWKAIVENDMIGMEQQSFLIKPKLFKSGLEVKTCGHCNINFLADKLQKLCKTCCKELSITHLTGESKESIAEKKYSRTFVEELAQESHQLGWDTVPKSEFNNFLKDRLDGNNTDKEETE